MSTTLFTKAFPVNLVNEKLPTHIILVIDDSPVNLDVVLCCLEAKNYQVMVAESGREGLRLAEAIKPDLILLDVMMPGIDGFETCRQLKSHESTKKIPVIFMTALTDLKSKTSAFECGGVDYITKPLQIEELLARVRIHISLQCAYKELEDSESRYRKLVEMTPDSIFVISGERINFLNTAAVKLLGAHTPQELLGSPFLSYAPEEHREIIGIQIHHALEQKRQEKSPLNVELLQMDGTKVDVEITCIPILFRNDRAVMFVIRDITERRQHQAEIEFQATHDLLTGLPNKRLLIDRITQSITHAKRQNKRLAIMFIDLDKFKQINDTLGHCAGDLLLQTISARLTNAMRECDTIARIGGDEFVLLVEDIDENFSLSKVASRVISTISKPVQLVGQVYTISCSIGISGYPDDAHTADSLLTRADIAMYRAKEAGRNTFHFFTPQMQEQLDKRVDFEKRIKLAIQNDQFILYYQPQVDLRTGKIIGIEALIRWNSPEYGFVSPGEFIPVAEESNLILGIGEWVLFKACEQLSKWKKQGVPIVPVAVNVASSQFTQQNLVELVEKCLKQYGLDAKYLELELTESLSMEDPERSIALMQQLNDLGASLSIDDFGTGYSNLSYLKRFPVSKLKIDRSFITGITNNPEDRSIVNAVIQMAHSLGLRTVAEGTETVGQISLLAADGCDEIQGYYFSRPVPEDEIAKLLQQQKCLDIKQITRLPSNRTLLVIDDDPHILNSLKRLFYKEPIELLTVSGTEEAYEILAHHEINVIICDLQLIGDTGICFFEKIKKLYPRTVRILLTGRKSTESLEDAINQAEVYKFIPKPWNNENVLKVLQKAFLHYDKSDLR